MSDVSGVSGAGRTDGPGGAVGSGGVGPGSEASGLGGVEASGRAAVGDDDGADHATGLIVGRFDPPHLGHSFMIDWAAQRCEQLVVFVNSSTASDTAPGELRAGWLAELHPMVHVREVRHQLWNDWDDEALWARWMSLFRSEWPLDVGPHVVFSSDSYVGEIARRFDAASVVVDADRITVPISATQVREAPGEHLHRLAPPVRAWVEANWI